MLSQPKTYRKKLKKASKLILTKRASSSIFFGNKKDDVCANDVQNAECRMQNAGWAQRSPIRSELNHALRSLSGDLTF